MNVQTHMSGQISGQVPNQAGSQMPVLSQHNGNSLAPQMQILGGPARAMSNMDPELIRARQIVQDRICQIIQQRSLPQPMNDRKFKEIVKKLDEGLLKSARDKDDYMNPETLESRLHNLITQPPNQSQQYQQAVNSSSPAGTMIPTPGMSHNGDSNMMVTSSMDASMNTARGSTGISPTTVNTGNLVPTGAIHGGSFNRSDGSMSNGYQQSPASFSIGTGGNMSSMGVQRMASQMIPTAGFNSSNNQSYMDLDSSNNGGGFSTVDSSMVTQPQQQKQHIGGQNSRILHSLGSQMNSGVRSGMQQKSYGLPNGALNGGLGFGNSLPVVNESGASEGYLTSMPYANSSKPLQQHFDQHQRLVMQGYDFIWVGQHNGNSLAPQMQNLGGPARAMSNMDPELIRARQIVQDRICQIIQQRQHPQPMNSSKFREIVKKLDEGLLKSARDKDDYMNPETLESRLHNLIKRPPNQSQQYQQGVNSSSPAGTMIPTPGMSHNGNSNMMVTSSMDASMNTARGSTGIAPTTVNTGNLVPTGAIHGGSFNRSDGSMSTGNQQSPASFSIGTGGNMSSMGVQRMASQMIPTPGFNSSNNHYELELLLQLERVSLYEDGM